MGLKTPLYGGQLYIKNQMNKVTTILNVYKRLDYLQDQLESIRNQTVPTDIWIDYTVPEGEQMYDLTEIAPDAKITVHQNQNFHHIGRFYHAFNSREQLYPTLLKYNGSNWGLCVNYLRFDSKPSK